MADPVLTPSNGKEVLVTGSLAFDQIMDFPGRFQDHILPDKLHMINLSFLVSDFRLRRGGCAANIAYTLALLGEKSRIVAAAGADFDSYREYLEDLGVDVSGIRTFDDLQTACCFMTTDRSNNQITGFHPGAMGRAGEISLGEAAKARKAEYAIVAPDDPGAMLRHALEAKEAGVPLLFDPSFQVIALEGDDLRAAADGAEAVFVNDYEFEVFKEKTGLSEKDLMGLARFWVVTLGEKGSRILVRGEGRIEVPAAKASDVVDPTGAGDAFRAGFMAGLLRDQPLDVCGRMGSVAGVYAIEHRGTQEHRYTQEEFAERFHASFG